MRFFPFSVSVLVSLVVVAAVVVAAVLVHILKVHKISIRCRAKLSDQHTTAMDHTENQFSH